MHDVAYKFIKTTGEHTFRCSCNRWSCAARKKERGEDQVQVHMDNVKREGL